MGGTKHAWVVAGVDNNAVEYQKKYEKRVRERARASEAGVTMRRQRAAQGS